MIEVGEYIRTDKDTEILKIIEVRKENKCITDKYPNLILQLNRDFTKYSKNIIDLIEVGDIVKIKNLTGDFIVSTCYHVFNITSKNILIENINNKEIELISILTHEQYEQNCYKVVI